MILGLIQVYKNAVALKPSHKIAVQELAHLFS